MNKISPFLTAMLLLSTSCVQAAVIPVTPRQMQRLGIRTAAARPAATQPSVSVLGRVTPAPDSRLPVSAPFAGSVQSLIRLEGESVRKGETLAVIASSEAGAALGRLQGQEAQYRSARAAADRARALVKEGIAPEARAEEAIAAEQAAAADLAASRSAMARANRMSDGSYRLTAPESGRIASVEAHVGDQVAAMQPVLTIDTRTELWVEGALPASAVGRVAPGDGVRVDGMADVEGRVVAAGTVIDPRTRSATMRARLTSTGALVGGQTVRLTVTQPAGAGSLTVPRTAVIELDGAPAVFVARSGGFEAVPVRVLARGSAAATIGGKLSPGDQVAISGLSELKAASGRD
jgi:cobalt-zinc-cadmium efflux system membrane fusion protein